MASGLEKLQTEQAAKENPDFWDNAVNAIVNRILGSQQAWTHVAEALKLPKTFHPTLGKVSSSDIDAIVAKSRPTEGWGGVLGDVLATAPLMALPGGAIAGGAAAGAATGLTEPVREGPESFWGRKITQTAIGGLIGTATGVLGKFLGEAAKRAPDAFNKEVINAALPPGGTVSKIGHAGIEEAQKLWDKAYAAITPRLRVNVDDELVNRLSSIEQSMLGEGATQEETRRFANVIVSNIIDAGDNISGDAVQNIQSKLGRLARTNRELGPFINQARDAFLEAAERASPDAAQELANLRANYPAFLAVQKAASASTSDAGIFTPNQLAAASRGVDISRNKARSAAGLGPFQGEIAAAREARVGEETTVQKLSHGLPIASGGIRLLEEQPAIRALGAGVEATTVPNVSAVAPMAERVGINAPDIIQQPSSEFETPASSNPQLNFDQFIKPYLERSQGGQKESLSQTPFPGAKGFDQFIAPYVRQSQVGKISSAIEEQESGGRNVVSPAGARGPMQIMPSTWRQYARPGENIDNPDHNRQVGQRIVSDLYDKYGDPRMVASAYFSGKPNYRSTKRDIGGKSVQSYVGDVMGRIG